MVTLFRRMRIGLALAAVIAAAAPASAQQILLDDPVKAGELVVFRDLNDEKAYYYVPSKPRLATDANGRKQFSFFRWVENTSLTKEAAPREGGGGGIIHALVTFGVPKELLRDAERDLQRQRAGARIAGPIVPKSGDFAVVTSMKQEKDVATKLALQIVGTGKAPLLDGDKAAVSILLTKEGAKILWEQFQTPTADISFSFEMKIAGYLKPKRALIEANLDEIVRHDSFAVGVASNWFAGEIKGAFDELRKKNVIKITQVGEDEKMDALVKTAYDKLVELLFEKSTPSPAAAAGTDAGGTSMMDRASTLLKASNENAEKVRVQNETIRKGNAERKAKRDSADAAEKRVQALEAELKTAEAKAAEAKRAHEAAKPNAAELAKKAADAQAAGAENAAALRQEADAAAQQVTKLEAIATKAEARVGELREAIKTARAAAETARKDATSAGPDEVERDVPSAPGFAVLASYQFKRQRATGIFRVDLNKYTSDERTFRFDENIGDLRPLFNNTEHFRQVNLDDPLYRQREIVAMVDVENAEDFGQFVNFVALRMRKKHESGELTHEEIRIDRKNFNQEGNHFKLLYGWKGDKNRTRWMDYEYQEVWSFFGGHQVEQPWKAASAAAINLAPPIQRRSVELNANPKLLTDQGVRSITVKVFYRPAEGAPEQVRQVTVNAAGEAVAGKIEFISPRSTLDYDYEISWRLTGNRTVSSGRQTTSSTILHIDEVAKPSSTPDLR